MNCLMVRSLASKSVVLAVDFGEVFVQLSVSSSIVRTNRTGYAELERRGTPR